MKNAYIGISIVAAVVIAALAFAFNSGASPFLARKVKADNARLGDFNQINSGIVDYYSRHGMLPASLSTLASEPGYYGTKTFADAETGKSYDYQILSGTSFKLCTVFSANSSDNHNGYYTPYVSDGESGMPTYKSGYDCITYAIPAYVLNKPGNPAPQPVPLTPVPVKSPPEPQIPLSSSTPQPM